MRGGLGWSHIGEVSLQMKTQVKVKVESTVIYKLGPCQLQGTLLGILGDHMVESQVLPPHTPNS